MSLIKREEICENVNFTVICDKKFKTSRISFVMFTPLSHESASANAAIVGLISRSCSKYPSLTLINRRLEELYGALIVPNVSKLGDMQVLGISAESINNDFAFDESDNVLEVASLMCEMLFRPDIRNEEFKEENVNQEKRQLTEAIEAEINDKKSYARQKCIEFMCENEKFGINPLGTKEQVAKLNGKILYDTWKNLIASAHIEIIFTGSPSYTAILNKFKSEFSSVIRKDNVKLQSNVIRKASGIKQFSENMDVSQCKLVMGFRTAVAEPDKETDAFRVFTALLGQTTQSKLFLNVREKLSLCYYCSARYDSSKGIMIIESGVEKQNIEKAKTEIAEQIKEIQLGIFSDEDLAHTKMFLTQKMEKINDSPGSISSWYIAQTLLKNKKDTKESQKNINKVTREQVIEAANKISADTVYILSGKEAKI